MKTKTTDFFSISTERKVDLFKRWTLICAVWFNYFTYFIVISKRIAHLIKDALKKLIFTAQAGCVPAIVAFYTAAGSVFDAAFGPCSATLLMVPMP